MKWHAELVLQEVHSDQDDVQPKAGLVAQMCLAEASIGQQSKGWLACLLKEAYVESLTLLICSSMVVICSCLLAMPAVSSARRGSRCCASLCKAAICKQCKQM